jgi:predicted TIM-barrel fold metal-dependent hydrolase
MAAAIIDAWIQHPTPAFLRDPMFASLRRWRAMPDLSHIQDIPDEFTLAALDAAGVGRALVTAWWGPSGPLLGNDEVAALVARHPDRLVGVASVDLLDPLAAVRELRRAVSDLGMRALRVLPWLWGLPPNDRHYYPLYVACIELGIPFCLQVGHAGPLRPSEPGRPIPYLDEVAATFPELVIVGGHIGYPWTQEMIALATKYDNVYIDTSAYKPSRYPPELVAYLAGHGRKKVLFGSNHPMIPPAACVAEVAGLGLDDEARALFLVGNATRVFGLT